MRPFPALTLMHHSLWVPAMASMGLPPSEVPGNSPLEMPDNAPAEGPADAPQEHPAESSPETEPVTPTELPQDQPKAELLAVVQHACVPMTPIKTPIATGFLPLDSSGWSDRL